MRYLLVDKNPLMVEAWEHFFEGQANVNILAGDLTSVTADAIVSPANSFGFMDGGVDYAISIRLGWDLQFELQKRIQALPQGELLVGCSMILETGDDLIPYLISSPTMRVPMSFNIASSINAYLAMKATLIVAKEHDKIEEIAIPGFCTGVGAMPPKISALQMFRAFEEIELGQQQSFADFGEAQKYHYRLNTDGAIWEA